MGRTPAAIVTAAALLLAALGPMQVAAAPTAQFRAFWVDAFGPGLNSDAEIDAVIAATKAANLNAIVAQVVRRGDCWCNHSIAPRTDALTVPAPFDPLASLITKAHAQGVEVHAWMIATGLWKGSTPPRDPQHPFNLHGPSAPGAASWIDVRSDGATQLGDEFFLDPGHPDAAQWVVDVATSLVANYDVDGVNLDRIRYPDGNLATNLPSWGYNPTAVAQFQAATGRADRPAPGDSQWAQWRRDQVTGIVRKIYLRLYSLRPRVRLSADTIAYGYGPQTQGGWTNTRTYAELLQDWRGWMEEGLLDLNIPMDYKRDADNAGSNNQRKMFSEWAQFAKDNQFRRQAVVGSALYLNDVAGSVRQVREALAPSPAGNFGAGWVGYSYRTPDALANAGSRSNDASRDELIRALTQASSYDSLTPAAFSAPAPIPTMGWKAAPSTGHVQGTVTQAGATLSGARVDLYATSTGALVASRATDSRGWVGFVDVAPGTYRVSSAGAVATVSVSAGQLATASLNATVSRCEPAYGAWIDGPSAVRSGVPGFHAVWYGQSGYATVCGGGRFSGIVRYFNSGSRGWVVGKMGEAAYLGTWEPEPGQDRPTSLGGDGQFGSPNTGWPRYNRVAVPTTAWVGPGQVGWFEFTMQAPTAPGTYRLSIRPLVEGTTWMEDYGVFWYVTVR
jgi:uncharacterized lipoprotein YddW (UPF0748 family)